MNNNKLDLKQVSQKSELNKIKKNFESIYSKVESFFCNESSIFIEDTILFNAHLNLDKLKEENKDNAMLRIADYRSNNFPIFKSQFPFFLFNTSDKEVFFVLGGALSCVFISVDDVMVSFTQASDLRHLVMLENISYKKNSYYDTNVCPTRTTNIFLNKLNNLLYKTKKENIKILNFDLNSSLALYKKYEDVSKNKMTVIDNKAINEYFEFIVLLNDKSILPKNILINTQKDNKITMVNK